MTEIDSAMSDTLRGIYGLPCWNAKQGYSHYLTFEFGEPHVEI